LDTEAVEACIRFVDDDDDDVKNVLELNLVKFDMKKQSSFLNA